mgnify:CR=1 FL=1
MADFFFIGEVMAEQNIDSLSIEISSNSQTAVQSLNKLTASLKKLKKEIGSGFNADGLKQSLRSLSEITPTTRLASKEIGRLVGSFKNLKQEMAGGFNAKEFKDIAKALGEVNSKAQNVGKSLSKQVNVSKVSEDLKKATKVDPKGLEDYKKSLKGLFSDFKIPNTLPEINKELEKTSKTYENLLEKQNKAITTNSGIEPDTKGYRNLLYEIEKVIAKTHELSKARLEASKASMPKKEDTQSGLPSDVQNMTVKGANDSPDTIERLSKAYNAVADNAKKAAESTNEFSKSVQTDDPSPRLKEAAESSKSLSDRLGEIKEKAQANVLENFLIPETIKNSESALTSLLSKLSSVKESMQQAFDLERIEEGSKRWEDYQYKIAAVNTKIEETSKALERTLSNNDKFVASDQFTKNLDQDAKKVSDVWAKAYENIKKNFKVPDTIKDLEKAIPTLEKNIAKLYESFQKDIDTGKVDRMSKGWTDYEYKIGSANAKLDITKNKLEELLAIEKEIAQTDVAPASEMPTTGGEDVSAKALTATVSFATLSKTIGKFSSTLDGLSGKMSNVLVALYAPLRHVVAEYKEKLGNIGNIFKKLGSTVESAAKKIQYKWNNLVHSFSKMVMRRALYAVLQTINDAMGSLANFAGVTGQKFNAAMSDMTSSARYAGANIVAAFSPLVNAIAPMIDALVEKMVSAITVINQFFAALTGQNVYVKAKKVVTDYAESVNKANKAQKDLVLGIDELNINNPNSSDSASGAAGDAYEWEEAPVLNKIQDFAEKVKKIFEQLFDPLKKAWDNAGDYVISGFRYMTGELSRLAAAIGQDFLTMWQEDATVRIFENILGIIGDIEYTIGNLAKNFREAWEENNVGLHIFENMRDIVGILIDHVRNVTKYMKSWSKSIDFRPMLNSFNGLLESLKPFADFIGGVFEDLMQNVVLKYVNWMIEDGIPHLNETIASIADAFDWSKMRSDMEPVEKAFEQLAENIHTGVVNALGNLGTALAEITGTEAFTSFMENIAKIMGLIDAELVEKVLTALGDGILKVADAVINFVGSEAFGNFLDKVKEWLDGLTVEDIEGILGGLAGAIIGFKFTSFIGEGFSNFMRFLTTISAFKGANLEGFGQIAAKLGSIGLVIGGLTLSVSSFVDMWKNGWNLIKTILEGLGIALAGIGAVLLGAPALVTAVVAGIVFAVSQLAIAIHDHWDEIKAWLGEIGGWINEHVIQPVAGFFSGLWEGIKDIWGTVSGWFSEHVIEPIVSIFEGFKKRAGQVWEGLKILVQAAWIVVSSWFDEHVGKPVAKVFNTVKDNVKKSFEELWKNVKIVWEAASTWFDKNVVQPIVAIFTPIKDTIVKIFDGIWSGIKKGAATAFNGIISIVEGAINGIIGGINGFFEGFNWLVDKAASIAGKDWSGVDLIPKVSLPRIQTYANGGFLGSPSSYSLFAAGENGIPEILGTVGGKSAVAGGEEITGIRDQVYESGIAEQTLLNQAISLLQVIADKNFNVELDGRSMVSQLNSRSARNGYSMATIS